MKVLLTGANGFLGNYLSKQLLLQGHQLLATGRGACRLPYKTMPGFSYKSIDLSDSNQIHTLFDQESPDYIIHAAAMGKPDECEQFPELATRINTDATYHLLQAAAAKKVHFQYISTDFVFDGVVGHYHETDHRNPINHYGVTKYEAEKWVEQYVGPWSIVRTVLVYGTPLTGRSNLLSIVSEKLTAGQTYQVVDDQIRTPTYVEDLASGILAMLNQRATGVFNICGEEILTPYQMAVRTALYLGLNSQLLIRSTSAAFQQPAKRPLRTGLTIHKARSVLGFTPITFDEGLEKTFGKR
jgi:dTDP-4-dehydrorhamnose reductase